MTIKVYKSQVGNFDFEGAVIAFRDAKLAHRFTEGAPAPGAPNALVEAAVKRVPVEGGPDDFVADYEFIDDTPPPPTPEEIKARKIFESQVAEQDEIRAIMPAGKLRLFQMQYSDAVAIPEAERNDAQRDVISRMFDYQAKVQAAQRRGAERESEIEDAA